MPVCASTPYVHVTVTVSLEGATGIPMTGALGGVVSFGLRE
jgi:hypothetical protein